MRGDLLFRGVGQEPSKQHTGAQPAVPWLRDLLRNSDISCSLL